MGTDGTFALARPKLLTKRFRSGHVAFVGGKQDAADGGDDRVTAVRETREELDLDLTDSRYYSIFGRLNDRPVFRHPSHPEGKRMLMAVSTFVYSWHSGSSSQIKHAAAEVQHVVWVPLRRIF